MKYESHGTEISNIALRLPINKTGNVRVTYIEGRSWNHYCSGKVISVTCYECVFVDLSIQQEMRMRYIRICGLSAYTIFF